MSLPVAYVGAKYEGVTIALTQDGEAFVVTGATITGRLLDRATATARAIAGTLSVLDGPNGVVTWAFHTNDLVAGNYLLQLKADFGSAGYKLSDYEPWVVEAAL